MATVVAVAITAWAWICNSRSANYTSIRMKDEQGKPRFPPSPFLRKIGCIRNPASAGFLFVGLKGRVQCANIHAGTTPERLMPIEFTLVSILFALVQVAIYLFLGRAAMWVFGGANRDQNFIYQLFKKGTEPLVKITRKITPKMVVDRHIPFATFLLLIWIGLGLIYARRAICVAQQLNCAI